MIDNKIQSIYDYNRIRQVIEKADTINTDSRNLIWNTNINNQTVLIEIGKALFNLVGAYLLYENFNKLNVNIPEIVYILKKTKTYVNNRIYNEWIAEYEKENIKLRYFNKELSDSYVYILISLLYLEAGFRYMFTAIKNEICNTLYYYTREYSNINDDVLYNFISREDASKIADILVLNGHYYYKELANALAVSSDDKYNSKYLITFLGICVTDYFAYKHIINNYYIEDLNSLTEKRGLILNVDQISRKIPSEIYKYLRLDEESIKKEYTSRSIASCRKIYATFYKVTALKNILGMLFSNYVSNGKRDLYDLTESVFNKYANIELNDDALNYHNAYRTFLYYYAKINNLSYFEHQVSENGVPSVCLRVCRNSNHGIISMIHFKNKDALSVHKEVFYQLYNYYLKYLPLLNDELSVYITHESKKIFFQDNRSKEDAGGIDNKRITTYHRIEQRKNIDFSDRKNTLYILKKTNSCQNRNHNVIAVTGILKNLRGVSVKINVNYCETCKKFFINKMDFDEFCKRHGIMLGNFSVKELNFGKGFNGSYKLADESPLHYCGYNVNKQKGLTESDRHKILANIIDFNIMKKTEIIEYLHFYINNIGNRANMNLAVSKWEDDLYFVNNYRINKQKSYRIDKIRQK